MNSFKPAPIAPVFSANPIPSIPTNTTPSGRNPMKLSTIERTAQYRPSPLSNPTARIVSVCGCNVV